MKLLLTKMGRSFVALLIVLSIFVYPVLAQAACPYPADRSHQPHAVSHHQMLAASKDLAPDPCHGVAHHNKPAPSSGHSSEKSCCAVSLIDFALVKAGIHFSAAKKLLDRSFVNFDLLHYDSANLLSADAGVYQHYAASQFLLIKSTPLYTRYHSFLV